MSTIRRPRRLRLSEWWTERDFLTFWAGQTVSLFGSRVTVLALPLTAILTLHASALQMGALEATGSGAALVFGLGAGVLADRVRRRPVMIAANLGQAAVLLSIPIAARLGVLRLPQLLLAGFLSASLGVFFDTARAAYLPSIVPAERLVDANGRLAASGSAAQVAGPGLGGALVGALGPPTAILADAVSFLVSALSLLAIRTPELLPARSPESGMWREAREGMRALAGNPLLRPLTAASAIFNLFDGVLLAVYILYMSRTLHLPAGAIGLVFGLAGLGGLLAAIAAGPLTARLGVGRAVLGGIALATAGELSIAAAGGPQAVAVLVLLVAEAAVELGAGLYAINAASLRTAATPEGLRGRVAATSATVTLGVGAIGALLGGLLGGAIGLRATVLVAGTGTLLCLPWILASPVRALRRLPA